MEFFTGFVIGGGIVGLAAYFYGKKAGLALRQVATNLGAAKNDLKKGL